MSNNHDGNQILWHRPVSLATSRLLLYLGPLFLKHYILYHFNPFSLSSKKEYCTNTTESSSVLMTNDTCTWDDPGRNQPGVSLQPSLYQRLLTSRRTATKYCANLLVPIKTLNKHRLGDADLIVYRYTVSVLTSSRPTFKWLKPKLLFNI